MAQIHPSSLVDPQAKLAENVVVGPFCTIGPHVEVGEGTTLQSHIVLTGHTKIGKNNKIYAFAAIGIDPQDKKYRGEETQLIIGDNNVIREHCTLSVGTVQDKGITIIGNGNLLMANVHVAHDCVIGNDTIIANNGRLCRARSCCRRRDRRRPVRHPPVCQDRKGRDAERRKHGSSGLHSLRHVSRLSCLSFRHQS